MSYMTPYYFSASANVTVSIWMQSNEVEPKIGLALSGSIIKLAESWSNAWHYSSSHAGAAIEYPSTASNIYKVEATSTGSLDSGSFKLYITQGATASISNADNPNGSGVGRLTYSPTANRMFCINLPVFGGASGSLTVANVFDYTIANRYDYQNLNLFDCVYNSVQDNVWVWYSGSSGQYLDVYDNSGSVKLATYSSSVDFQGHTPSAFFAPRIVHNPVRDHFLMVPTSQDNFAQFHYYIYDCSGHSFLYNGQMNFAGGYGWYPIYVSSSNRYYITSDFYGDVALRIDPNTYASSSSRISSSAPSLTYIPELNILVGGGNYGFIQQGTIGGGGDAVIYNAATEDEIARVPGIIDLESSVVYDACRECLVFPDDGAGGSYNIGGGLSFVNSGSWTPQNFIAWPHGVDWIAYANATSTVWVSNYYDGELRAYVPSNPTASLPQPPLPTPPPIPPLAPIFLEVVSGSAKLNWQVSASTNANYYTVQKSLTNTEAGPYSEITTSLTTHSIDTAVFPNNTYWYRVASVNNNGTSSFSNLAAINIIPCNKAAFDPIVISDYISYSSGSTYKNTYGVLLPYTTSVSQSISVWGRSPDFDVYLTLVDSTGSILTTDDWDGWNPTGDQQGFGKNAAFVYHLDSGSYFIEISSADNNVGRFNLVISPGPKLETTWSNSIETAYCQMITSVGWVLVGENGVNAVWYNPADGTTKVYNPGAGVNSAHYSPKQDKCYVWGYYQTGGQYTQSIDVFDNTGSLLHTLLYYRGGSPTVPNMDFSGYSCYDEVNDRILYHDYSGFHTPQRWTCLDLATEIIVHTGSLKPLNSWFADAWRSSYSDINNAYYIGFTGYHPMIKIDASSFAMSLTTQQTSIMAEYISSSNVMMIRGGGTPGTVQFFDPLTDTIIHNQTDLPNAGMNNSLFDAGASGDLCSNAYVVCIDPKSGDGGVNNKSGVALLDRNTFLPVNYLAINNDVPSGFAPDGWYTYSTTFDPSSSKVYFAQQSYDFDIGRLYSIIPSRAFMPIISPFTSSASDTASCMTFKTELTLTHSQATRVLGDLVCSSKNTASNAQQTLVVSDMELDDSFTQLHNFNNIFMSASGQYFNNYTGSTYIHGYSGKNAVWANNKYYMMSDGTTAQSVFGWTPVSGTAMLVFDNTGSLLTTIPLTYGGRDWDSDGISSIWVYEMSNGSSSYIEQIDTTTDTISNTYAVAYSYGTPESMSVSASTNPGVGQKEYPYFSRIFAFNNGGNSTIFVNNIKHASDTGSGDRIELAAGGWYLGYNEVLDFSQGQFKKWSGGAVYCPLTTNIYWTAVDVNNTPIIVETNTNLGLISSHSLSGWEVPSMVWNKKNRTIEMYSNIGAYGLYIYDPVAKTLVCGVDTTITGSPMGDMGWNIDANVTNGDVYVPMRYVDSPAYPPPGTGSVKVWKV